MKCMTNYTQSCKMLDSQTSLLFVPDKTLVLSPFFNVQSHNLATKNWKCPKFARISMYEIFKYSKRNFCLFVFSLFFEILHIFTNNFKLVFMNICKIKVQNLLLLLANNLGN